MKKIYSLILLILSFSTAAFAEPLALAELIDIALQNNPETEQVWWNIKRSRALLGIAESNNYPSLDATSSVIHAREVTFPNGFNTDFTSFGAELTLSYMLLDFGYTSANIQATKDGLRAANWNGDFTMQRIMYEVAARYYEYLNAQILLKSKESTLADSRSLHNNVNELYENGLKPVTDLNSSSATVALYEMGLAQQRALVNIAYGKLMTSLGLPIDSNLQVQDRPQAILLPIFSESICSLIEIANERRADLMAKRAKLDEANALVKSAKRSSLPKLQGIGQVGYLKYTKHQGSGYNHSIGLSLQMPIFSGFEYTYQTRRALAEAELTAAELRELQNDIALEILTYSESVKAAQEALKWSEDYLDQATKAYDCCSESYRAGLQSIFDLLKSQEYLADARIKSAQARTQWLLSLAQLAFATGSMVK